MGIEVLTPGILRASNIELFKNLETMSNTQAWRRLCMFPPSTGAKTETYEWLGELPGMTEWLAGRVHKGLKKYKYTLENKAFESTLAFDRADLQDKVIYNQIKAKMPMLAQVSAEHPMQLLIEVVKAGITATGVCFDGKYFFSTTHPCPREGGNTFSNLLTGTGVDTVAHIKADFSSALIAFKGYRRRNGSLIFGAALPKPILMYDVIYDTLFQETFMWQNSATATLNPYFGQVDSLLAVPDLGNDWVLTIPGMPVAPFMFQEKKALAPSDTTMGSGKGWETKNVFDTGGVEYGVDAEYNMGYGLPQLAIWINN